MVSGFCAIGAGIYAYRINPKHPSDFPLEALHAASYLLVLGILEIRHYME